MRLNRSCVQLIVIRCVDHLADLRRLFIDIGITTRVLFGSFIVVGEETIVTSLTRSDARPNGETKGIPGLRRSQKDRGGGQKISHFSQNFEKNSRSVYSKFPFTSKIFVENFEVFFLINFLKIFVQKNRILKRNLENWKKFWKKLWKSLTFLLKISEKLKNFDKFLIDK